MIERFCRKCQKVGEFTSNKAKYCRLCIRILNREYASKKGVPERFIPVVLGDSKQCGKCLVVKHKDLFTVNPRGRLKRSAYCKPCMSVYQLNYTSPEDRRANTQRWRDGNRSKWRSAHRLSQFKRRTGISILGDGSVTPNFLDNIYSTENCYYCRLFTEPKNRTLEHKIPLTKGGMHSSSNIVMACKACNFSKNNKTEEEFYEFNQRRNHCR